MSNLITNYRPGTALRDYVQSYWTGSFNTCSETGFSQVVVPNGFVELIIHLTDDHCFLTRNDQHWKRSPNHTLIGLYKKPYEVRFSRQVEVFAIRFFPEGILRLFGIPPAEFVETYEDSTNVMGDQVRDFCCRLRDLDRLHDRIQLTDKFLQTRLHENKNEAGVKYMQHAAVIIRNHHGLISQEQLTGQVYISPRQLQRVFKQHLGLTVKEYMRLARINAVQRYLKGQQQINYSDAAYDHGFADQSHFIREFKRFTGYSPGTFQKERDQFIVNHGA